MVGTDPAGDRGVSTPIRSHYFGVVSGIDVEKHTNGEDADAPTGPVVTVGGAVNWTYVVRNTGNIPIQQVALVDDGGVAPALSVGDADGDEQLDPDETWTYAATGTATAGQYVNTATVTGLDMLEDPVSDSDPSHYFAPPPVFPQPQPPLPQPPASGPGRRRGQAHRDGDQAGLALARAGGDHGAVHAAGPQRGQRHRAPRARVRSAALGPRLRLGARGADRRSQRLLQRGHDARAAGAHVRRVARADATSRPRRICNVAVRTASGLSARRARECVRILPTIEPRPGGVTG